MWTFPGKEVLFNTSSSTTETKGNPSATRTGVEMRAVGNPRSLGLNEDREMVIVIIINVICYGLFGECLIHHATAF